MIRAIIYMLVALVLSINAGCKAEYLNVSANKEFSEIIDRKYQIKIDLRIEGIGAGGEGADFFLITEFPKVFHDAPEIVSSSMIHSGTTFKVIGIFECDNCLFSSPVFVSIRLPVGDYQEKLLYFPLHVFRSLVDDKKINKK